MRPLSLTLTGFRGIRDGLGLNELTLDFERLAGDAQLVALAGANGRGKSTVMENLTPYMTMPSRAAMAGPGGFSYYDHVFLPESIKDLTWAHEGTSYRSQIVIRLAGRRKTEAYLHKVDTDGCWRPVVLDDGTVSDGKVETYNRCVEAICGNPDTFFTSMFSAQGKRPLSAYRNAEIKALLADLLGQEQIRALGQQASEVARLLKGGLTLIRQEASGIEGEAERVREHSTKVRDAKERVIQCQGQRERATRAVERAQDAHARLLVERDQARGIEVRREQLAAEHKALVDADSQAQRRAKEQERSEATRLERLEQRVAARQQREGARRQLLVDAQRRALGVLAGAQAAQRAARRLPLAERVLPLRIAQTRSCRGGIEALRQCQAAERLAEQKLAAVERDAGKAALKAEELSRRFGLAREVPCAGTDLQGLCKLLGDAREARTLIPDARAQIARFAQAKASIQTELSKLRQQRQAMGEVDQALVWAEWREEIARARVVRLTGMAAQVHACEQARASLVDIEAELAAIGPEHLIGAHQQTPEEQAERQQIVSCQTALQRQESQRNRQHRAALSRLDTALAALPAPYDGRALARAAESLAGARAGLSAAEQAHVVAIRDAQTLEELQRQADSLAGRLREVGARRERVESELGAWNLLVRCLSNDGLIALAIDDAGPALSGLANDLLLACYGPRFTVSIQTLLETCKGEQKEGFDIVVHDAETGDSKSVSWMSGGEKTIVESCMTRAIALYLAQTSGRQYSTLFSDEADGALDADRKRMFMAMKREVLRLGRYEQEYFISQTPELTAMADAVIDLDLMCARNNGCVEPCADHATA